MKNKKGRKLNSFHKTAIILLKSIERKPGIRYRQLLRKTNLVNSVLSYHLGTLEKSKSIKVNRSYGRTSYYPTYVNKRDWKVIECISNSTSLHIVQFLISRNYPANFKEMVKHTGRAPSTISYHLKSLVKTRIIISVDQDNFHKYKLLNKSRTLRILSEYS
jgi:predicted transcriptional regulator